MAIPANVPDDLIARPSRFPANWDAKPAPDSTKTFGDRFLAAGKFPVMRVPSVTVRGEFCFLLNPTHPEFAEIAIGQPESFVFDGRAIEE